MGSSSGNAETRLRVWEAIRWEGGIGVGATGNVPHRHACLVVVGRGRRREITCHAVFDTVASPGTFTSSPDSGDGGENLLYLVSVAPYSRGAGDEVLDFGPLFF